MVGLNAAADAQLGYIVACCFDMFAAAGAAVQDPPLDPRLADGWILRGHLTGLDTLLRSNSKMQLCANRVFYGFLAESTALPGLFVIPMRGTADMIEWIEDGEFEQVPHPAGGQVEAGFYGVHQSLVFRDLQGNEAPAIAGIKAAVGGGRITVIGHSLGAALATYLTLDLVQTSALGQDRVKGRFFASPRPGNSQFATLFDKAVPDYQAYAYELDLVPRVPFGFDYSPLTKLNAIDPDEAQARICFGPACGHHIYSYLSMLDWTLMDWTKAPAIDKGLTACIKGPGPAFLALQSI